MNPALAVLQTAAADKALGLDMQSDVLWVGGVGGMEADLVRRAGVPYDEIPAAGVHGVGIRSLPGNLWRLARGLSRSRRILGRFQPDVVFFTGGYLAVPMAIASRLPGVKRPRSLLYIPDIEPGLALKTLVRFSDHAAITAAETRSFLPASLPSTITGYPTRPELKPWNRDEAYLALQLDPSLPVLLVMGGSKGARGINRALLNILPDLLAEMQIVHMTGQLDWPEVQQAAATLPAELSQRYRPFPYLQKELGAAMTVASLALTRAGASTLGELPLFGLPTILVPYPYAWRYQHVNADYLVKHGAAILMEEADLPASLKAKVQDLIQDAEQLARMQAAMYSLASPQAAAQIAEILQKMAEGRANG